MLGVAVRHVDDARVDFDLLALSLLPAAFALAADGDGDLVAGSAFVGGTAEDVARHEKEGGVFVERPVGLAAELGHGFAESGEGFGSDLHAQDVSAQRWIGAVVGLVARLVTRHELFDLAEVRRRLRRGAGATARQRGAYGVCRCVRFLVVL